MTKPAEGKATLPMPRTDEDVFQLLDPFPVAIADGIGATARLDEVVTIHEYQAVAEAAQNLDGLTPLPNLMKAIVLRAVLEGPSFGAALRRLRNIAKDRPEQERIAVLDAVGPMIQTQPDRRQKIAAEWAGALHLEGKIPRIATEEFQGSPGRFLAKFATFRSTKENLLEKAHRFVRTFNDARLASFLSRAGSSSQSLSENSIKDELAAAVERVLQSASAGLKSQAAMDDQIEVSERFLKTAEALAEQIRLRLQSVKDRLDLQSQLFQEDLDDFVRKAADSVEISMRDLMEERRNWADKTIWEQFNNRGVRSEVLATFHPLKHRYERLFDQWHKELESFAKEVGVMRVGVLRNVDPRAFTGLLPTDHYGVTAKNTIDRAADVTLSVTALGALASAGVVALTAVEATAIAALVANPLGAAVGAVALSAAAWKIFSNPGARKRKLIQTKRQVLEKKLRELLETEVFNHTEAAQGIMNKFLEAAFEQYAPLIIDARMAALSAKLEAQVARRMLNDTRKVLLSTA